jgi:hypothetical protein
MCRGAGRVDSAPPGPGHERSGVGVGPRSVSGVESARGEKHERLDASASRCQGPVLCQGKAEGTGSGGSTPLGSGVDRRTLSSDGVNENDGRQTGRHGRAHDLIIRRCAAHLKLSCGSGSVVTDPRSTGFLMTCLVSSDDRRIGNSELDHVAAAAKERVYVGAVGSRLMDSVDPQVQTLGKK